MQIDPIQLKADLLQMLLELPSLTNEKGDALSPYWPLRETLGFALEEIDSGDLEHAKSRILAMARRIRNQRYKIELPLAFQLATLDAADHAVGRQLRRPDHLVAGQ